MNSTHRTTPSTTMTADPNDTEDVIRTAIWKSLKNWGITIPDRNYITLSKVGVDLYEAKTPIENQLILDTFLQEQGPLFGIVDDIEVSLKGFGDGQLLLEVKPFDTA